MKEILVHNSGDNRLWQVADSTFKLPKNYEVIKLIGSGTNGKIVSARDTNEPEGEDLVAIKKMDKVFDHKTIARRTLRELRIIRLLQHENLLAVRTIIGSESIESFDDFYVVMDLMDSDLESIIKSK